MFVRLRGVGLIIFFVAASSIFVTCGGKSPTKPGPVPGDIPTPTSTDPTPVPTPEPTPLPGMSCGAPAVDGVTQCAKKQAGGAYEEDVNQAINDLMASRPDIFNGTVVVNLGAYHTGIVRNLEAKGYCAIWDGEEVAVKAHNGFSEQYHPSFSNRSVVRPPKAYRATCTPAWFPVNPQPLPQRGDCALPSSKDMGCDRLANGEYIQLVDRIIDEIAADSPHLVDVDFLLGTYDEYYEEMVQRLRTHGVCAIFDGEEIAIKKTNEFSEQYHPILSSKKIRKGYGSYRATCTPATY
jgi:hypothetical protein